MTGHKHPAPSLVLLSTLFISPASCFILFATPDILRTPDSQFSRLAAVDYPWQPNYLEVKLEGYPQLRMHYLDEGPKDAPETVLLLHGTPSWSYSYRKMIPTLLKQGYRVVAPDFIGCGRSDKLTSIENYSHTLHVLSLMQLIDTLDLKDVTLVGHDLGGPIGGSVLMRRPDRFKRLVLMNTWLPQGDVFSSFSRFTEHLAYLSFRVLTKFLGLFHPVTAIFLTSSSATLLEVLHGYVAPFPDQRYKAGVAAWPPMIPLYPDEELAKEMQAVAQYIKSSWSGPALVGYSDRELFTLPGGALLREVLPSACPLVVTDAGHFLQEDQGEDIAAKVVSFVEGGCGVGR